MLAERGRALLRDAAALMAAVREEGEEPRGELRLILPGGAHPGVVAMLMAAMRQKYPSVTVRLRTADDPISALEHEADVAITLGARQPGGRWVSMKVMPIQQRLLASESYLAQRGPPTSVEDLAAHELISWDPPGESPLQWHLRSGGTIEVAPALISPDVHLIRQVAGEGQGLVYAPDGLPTDGPVLLPVLDDVLGRDLSMNVVVPVAMERIPRIRALLGEVRALRDAFLVEQDAFLSSA